MWSPKDDSKWIWQRGSFLQPVAPPTTEICDPPLYCISINQQWLAYLAGAAMQLAQPSTWLVSSESDRLLALARATDLIAEIGNAVPCISPPPSPTGTTAPQQACNIAGYLAFDVIKVSIQQAVDQFNGDNTLFGFGSTILNLIPGAVLVYGILKAVQVIWTQLVDGNVTDFQDAAADPTLWSEVTCAIYSAIHADGQVTDGNFPTIVANVGAISYVHADVITALVGYINNLGASGLEQLQQVGALADYDCTGCGGAGVTGPAAPPAQEAAGQFSATIHAGSTSFSTTVVFENAFSAAPTIVATVSNPDLIVSISARSTSQFTAIITAAVPAAADMTTNVYWLARIAGSA